MSLLKPGLVLLSLVVTCQASAAERPPSVTAGALDPERHELNLAPLFSADLDRGVGFGAIAALARFGADRHPYRWRLEALAFMTARAGDGGGVELPFHRYQVRLDLPGLLDGRLRLNVDLSFVRSMERYYGVGNASPDEVPADDDYHGYQRLYPRARLLARIGLSGPLSLMLGTSYTYNKISLTERSRLTEDLGGADAELRQFLGGAHDHSVAELGLGLIWDTRDHEVAPSRGVFHEISWRFSPGPVVATPYAYGGLNLTLRGFLPLLRDRLVLAGRLLVDLLAGSPPFYELARHGGLSPGCAPGGGSGVRGVPQYRYHGKVKALANLELRAKLLPFSILGQRFNLGALLFFDTGRVWADVTPRPALDGDGPGLKVGLGSGLRLQWGETFIVRADLAWSPDADPVGFYFNVNHIF